MKIPKSKHLITLTFKKKYKYDQLIEPYQPIQYLFQSMFISFII